VEKIGLARKTMARKPKRGEVEIAGGSYVGTVF